MAFEKVSTKRVFVGGYQDKKTEKPQFKKGEILIEGHYTKEGISIYKGIEKPIHIFKSGIDKTIVRLIDKKEVAYKKGEMVVLNGTGLLNYNLRNDFELGTYMRILYQGQDVIQKKGEDDSLSHQFSYEVDPDKSMTVTPSKDEAAVDENDEVSLSDLE